jgi:hypothetical protein
MGAVTQRLGIFSTFLDPQMVHLGFLKKDRVKYAK